MSILKIYYSVTMFLCPLSEISLIYFKPIHIHFQCYMSTNNVIKSFLLNGYLENVFFPRGNTLPMLHVFHDLF